MCRCCDQRGARRDLQPSTFKAPIELEIQIWAAAIMDLNDVSHWQYEVARADDPRAYSSPRPRADDPRAF